MPLIQYQYAILSSMKDLIHESDEDIHYANQQTTACHLTPLQCAIVMAGTHEDPKMYWDMKNIIVLLLRKKRQPLHEQ